MEPDRNQYQDPWGNPYNGYYGTGAPKKRKSSRGWLVFFLLLLVISLSVSIFAARYAIRVTQDNGIGVWADEDAITQVVYNLIDNAVKFCEEGGSLFAQVESDGMKATVSVANTGQTIAEEELPLLFDRFHKTDKSRSADREGVGLGLHIVRTIVVTHGEDISVTSRDGVTRFSFTLPVK